MSQYCPQCGKEASKNAGSVTSFFFQHNFCQCHRKGEASTQKFEQKTICSRCGKSTSGRNKGSFTGYLFKELRCQCSQPLHSSSPANNLTTTAMRARRYTEEIRKIKPTDFNRLPLTHGTTVGGAFQIHSVIGEGGMGIVYLARQLSMGRDCALKVLTPELVNEQNWLRFKAEAKTLSTLNHPTLVNVYDLGVHENRLPFYAMDYLEGRTLEHLLIDDGPLDLARAIEIFLPVLDGLTYAHRHHIIHRDIKPANIFLCTNGDLKILDFGISKLSGEGQQQLTQAGEIFGSPFYMSPEQCRGDAVDHRSDIYSVGCALMEALTGHVPFESDSSIDIAMQHQEDEIPLLSQLSSRMFPPSVDVVLGRALAKLPQDRYQSAKELEIDLLRIADGKNVEHHLPGKRQQSGSRGSSSPSNWLIPVAISLALVGILSYVIFRTFLPTKPRPLPKPAVAEFEQSAAAILQQTVDLDTQAKEQPFSPELAARVKKYLTYAPETFSQVVKIDKKDVKIFSFPPFSIGKLTCFRGNLPYGYDAINKVRVPPNVRLIFEAHNVTVEYPELLQRFRSDELKQLIFPARPSNPDTLWAAIGRLESLGTLRLSMVPLEEKHLKNLNSLNQLTSLAIDDFVVPPDLLVKVKALSRVEALGFSGGAHCTPVLKLLAQNQNLHYLTVRDAVLSEEDLNILASMKQLLDLNLPHSNLTNESLDKLSKMKQLRGLDVYNTRVDQRALPVLLKFTNLERLRFSAFDWTEDEEEKFRTNFPRLKRLDY